MEKNTANSSDWISKGTVSEWIVPVAAVALVFVMLVPLAGLLLDVLLAVSITAAVLVLLSAVQILRPVQFSVFPSLVAAVDACFASR